MKFDCPYSGKCPMFPRFRNELGLSLLMRAYCQSERFPLCKRYSQAVEGTMPPPDLLPNGRRLAE